MKIENNKITECNDLELWLHWYDNQLYLIMDFLTYRAQCIEAGTIIND